MKKIFSEGHNVLNLGFRFLAHILILLCWTSYLSAKEIEAPEEHTPEFWEENTLSGDWGGFRSDLAKKGFMVELEYIGEIFSNLDGGIRRRTEYLDNINLKFYLDAERLVGWEGATFFFHLLGNQGGDPSLNDGGAPPVSNIEAPDTFKLYEAWFEQSLFDDKFSFKVGLYDLNTEFDVKEVAALFINDAFGTSPDLSQAGLNSVSIFPVTSVGARIIIRPIENFYIQGAVLDGVPGDPDDPFGTSIEFNDGDGVLTVFEGGYQTGLEGDRPYRKFAIGGWFFSAKFDDILDVDTSGDPIRHRGNSGIYGIAEGMVLPESNDFNQGLSAFLRVGMANDAFNQFDLHVGAGLNYTGLIPGRDEDQAGMAISVVFNGDDFIRANQNAGTSVDSEQILLEWTYHAQINPWFAVQPDFQYYINPGTDPSLDNALQFGFRFEFSF